MFFTMKAQSQWTDSGLSFMAVPAKPGIEGLLCIDLGGIPYASKQYVCEYEQHIFQSYEE